MKKMIILFCLQFLFISLIGCSKAESDKGEEETIKRVKPIASSTAEEVIGGELLAEEFIELYINQEFDLERTEKKEERLKELVGDVVLDAMLADIELFKYQLTEYLDDNQLDNTATVILVERDLQSVEVYRNGAKYLVDVKYEESSPAYSGSFAYRKHYTFKIEEGKITHFQSIN